MNIYPITENSPLRIQLKLFFQDLENENKSWRRQMVVGDPITWNIQQMDVEFFLNNNLMEWWIR